MTSDSQRTDDADLVDLIGTGMTNREVDRPDLDPWHEGIAGIGSQVLAVADARECFTDSTMNDDNSHTHWSGERTAAHFVDSSNQ
jgi:hypothetical protein